MVAKFLEHSLHDVTMVVAPSFLPVQSRHTVTAHFTGHTNQARPLFSRFYACNGIIISGRTLY